MVYVTSVSDIAELIHKHTLNQYLLDLIATLKHDFSRWDKFDKIPRPAFHVSDGVMELMPVADDEYFSFKYVNGHPKNPNEGKQTVVGTGQIATVGDGIPLLISEMTLLTALRTAATAAIATDLLARADAESLALIGNGSQSDFQAIAHCLVRNIKTIYFYDTDPAAMQRFQRNMKAVDLNVTLIACEDAKQAVQNADIITVCTACKEHVDVIKKQWIQPGAHINGLGGDCPGKTELEQSILPEAKVVVEFFEQSFIEGEIQRFDEQTARSLVDAELWELVTHTKPGRTSEQQITVFDSVGFAMEDFSALKLTFHLLNKYHVGRQLDMIPQLSDPKDLFSVLTQTPSKINLNASQKATVKNEHKT